MYGAQENGLYGSHMYCEPVTDIELPLSVGNRAHHTLEHVLRGQQGGRTQGIDQISEIRRGTQYRLEHLETTPRRVYRFICLSFSPDLAGGEVEQSRSTIRSIWEAGQFATFLFVVAVLVALHTPHWRRYLVRRIQTVFAVPQDKGRSGQGSSAVPGIVRSIQKVNSLWRKENDQQVCIRHSELSDGYEVTVVDPDRAVRNRRL